MTVCPYILPLFDDDNLCETKEKQHAIFTRTLLFNLFSNNFGVVLLYDLLSPVEYHVMLNYSSISLSDVVKGEHVPKSSQDIHNN